MCLNILKAQSFFRPNCSDTHSLDSPRKYTVSESLKSQKSPSKDSRISSPSSKRGHVAPLNLNPPSPDPVIVHPAVVVTILRLLPGKLFKKIISINTAEKINFMCKMFFM